MFPRSGSDYLRLLKVVSQLASTLGHIATYAQL